MKLKKVLMLLAVLFPLSLIVGMLASLVYTSYSHEGPHIDWVLVLSVGAFISIFFVWYNRRELKGDQKAS